MSTFPNLLEFLKQTDYSVAIFDLDNTLVDLNVDWGALKMFLKKKHEEMFGTPQDFTRLMIGLECVQRNHGQAQYELFSNLIAEWEISAAKTRAIELKNRTCFLPQLKNEGKYVAIFTGNVKEAAEIVLERFNLLKSVDFIVGRRESPKLKPDPSGLQIILAHFKITPQNAIYIGDAEIDLAAGKAAGIPTFILS